MEIKTSICLYCKQEMEIKTSKKMFCSDKCRVYYNRKNTNKYKTHKSDIINVIFDLEKLELIMGDQNLESHQSVLNYLMDNYRSPIISFVEDIIPIKDDIILKEKNKPEPPLNLKGIDLAIWKSENRE